MRAPVVAAVCLLISSCTGAGLADLEVGNPKYAAPGQVATSSAPDDGASAPAVAPASTGAAASGTVVSLVQEQEAQISQDFVPAGRPQRGEVPASVPVAPTQTASAAPALLNPQSTVASVPASVVSARPEPEPEPAGQVPAAVVSFAPPEPPKKKGFLANLFSAKPVDAPVMSSPAAAPKPKPVIALASAATVGKSPARAALDADDRDPVGGSALPGVRRTSLFEIRRKDSVDDDSDVDLHEDEEAPVQYASAAGLGRLTPNGLLIQRPGVDVSCLKPSLVRMLKQMEHHFGKRVVVTSGYRSPEYNRRVRGARRSMHMFCAAADIQIEGVGKHEMARYARAMPGRGGVGTYCHTNSVHIDVGPERDWNWRCRSRKRRK